MAVHAVKNGVVLTLDDAAGHLGASNAFDVTFGPLDHFQWSEIVSPQYENGPIAVALTAQDAHGYTVEDYDGTVDLSALVRTGSSSSLVVSEIDVGALDRIEFTNVSGLNMDVGGWKIFVYDTSYPTTPQLALTIPVGTTCEAGGVFVVDELGTGPGAYPHFFTGTNLNWTPMSVTGVLLVDCAGNVRDFVAASALNPAGVTDPIALVPDHWQGAQVAAISGTGFSYQRVGNMDNDVAADWVVNLAPSVGALNPGLTQPFTGTHVAIAPTSATLAGGVWTGQVTVLQTASDVYLRMNDGAGHVHNSNAFDVLPPTLLIEIPTDANETAGLLAGAVRIPGALSSDLVVHLASSNPSRLGVPETVTIPAGQTSAAIEITVLDNTLLDGLESIAVTATAADYVAGTAALTVHDDEAATLTVHLPASATEGDGVLHLAGVVTTDAAPTRDIVVELISSDTSELTVPSTIILQAGQTSAVFDLTVEDDTLIDGPQTVIVTARVENWADGSATMDVLDDDRTLSLTLPADVWEGEGTRTGEGVVQIGGTLPTDLVVSLSSNMPGELQVPATVTIPAGQTSAAFDLTVVDDGDLDGAQWTTVTAASTGFADGTASSIVHDNEVAYFVWEPIDSPNTAGVAFGATVRARNVDGETILVYGETLGLAGAGLGGAVPVTPSDCTFVSGVWTGDVTVGAVDNGIVLTIDDGAGHVGNSNAFDIHSGPLAGFQWSTIATPQYQNIPFTVTLTAVDANGYTVTDFNGMTDLSGWVGGSGSIAPPSGTPVASGNVSLLGTDLQLGVNADGSLIVQNKSLGARFLGNEFLVPGTPQASFSLAVGGELIAARSGPTSTAYRIDPATGAVLGTLTLGVTGELGALGGDGVYDVVGAHRLTLVAGEIVADVDFGNLQAADLTVVKTHAGDFAQGRVRSSRPSVGFDTRRRACRTGASGGVSFGRSAGVCSRR